MDVKEIRELSDEAVDDAILDKREEIFNLRFQKEAGQMENTNMLRYAKRDLSRLLLVKRERQLAAQVVEDGA